MEHQTAHKECYGGMFPDTLHLEEDKEQWGRVFTFKLARRGGLVRTGWSVAANTEEWDACLRCLEFGPCYQLSLGKLLLETAIGGK